jgi:hypothetical protein
MISCIDCLCLHNNGDGRDPTGRSPGGLVSMPRLLLLLMLLLLLLLLLLHGRQRRQCPAGLPLDCLPGALGADGLLEVG